MAKTKLCNMVKDGFHKDHKKEYKELIKNPRYMCKKCGRSAAKTKNLCKPVKL